MPARVRSNAQRGVKEGTATFAEKKEECDARSGGSGTNEDEGESTASSSSVTLSSSMNPSRPSKTPLPSMKDNMWHNNTGASKGLLPGRRTIGPLLLLLWTPVAVVSIVWIIQRCNGEFGVAAKSLKTIINSSILKSRAQMMTQTTQSSTIWLSASFWKTFASDLTPHLPRLDNPIAWKIIGVFTFMALALTRLIPCRMMKGPISPTGYQNTYHANGVAYYLMMNFLFIIGTKEVGILNLYNAGIFYDHYYDLIGCLTLLAVALCVVLYIKGLTFPSSEDCGVSGNVIFDFFYGTELYPNILGWDVKQFTNDRFGLTWWALACLSFAAKQMELRGGGVNGGFQFSHLSDAMLLSVSLQWIYLLKFFIWEVGYFYTMDIQHDRAGYYICWGCLVFVPSIYTSSTHWHVKHFINYPALLPKLGVQSSGKRWIDDLILNRSLLVGIIFIVGVVMIYINYDADRQRKAFRDSGGKLKIWGKKNPDYIAATFKTENGQVKKSLLLADGYWGLSRHFHYVPEILAAFCWAPPCTFSYFLPYFYTVYLMILLTDRAWRDDARCASKYAHYWWEYRKKVPYKIIPYII